MATQYQTASDDEDWIAEPELSRHCLERYDERTPPGAPAPETALLKAIPDDGIVQHPRFGDASDASKPQPDRIWIYTDYADGEWFTIVFVESGGVAVTCWRGDQEVVYEAIAAYLVVRGLEGFLDE